MKRRMVFGITLFILVGMLAACSDFRIELPSFAPLTQNEEVPVPEVTELPADTPAAVGPIPPNLSIGLADIENAYKRIYEQVLPSVVSINVTTVVTESQSIIPELPFDFNIPQQDTPREFQRRGAGSGFVWDTQGHIVTNNHVIDGASVIRVRFSDGTSVLGEVVGADSDSDLAIIKVDVPADQLKPIEIADSTRVRVGQIAVAIGNPFQLEGSMTTGIISGVGRSLALESGDGSGALYSIPDVIQTDAAINPGNSGGVLVDIEGRLIGVTTAIESPVRGNTGVGYVVPSVIVEKVIPILIREGDYQHPYIGISGTDLTAGLAELMDLPSTQRGALVLEITPGSPADEAGLIGSDRQALLDGQEVRVGGDVITAVDGQSVEDFEDLITFLARYANVDQTITLTILRDDQPVEVPLTLAARPGRSSAAETPREIRGQAWLGISGANLTPEAAEAMGLDVDTQGVIVQQVTAGSPADEAGIRGSFKPLTVDGVEILIGGDVITKVDGNPVESISELSRLIGEFEPGDEITLSVLRDGKELDFTVRLRERPQ